MKRNMQERVLFLLENYPKASTEISLMRFELQNKTFVSPEDIIEVLSFSQYESSSLKKCPHDVEEIANCFREISEKLNKEYLDEIANRYIALLRERERLLHYISLLSPRQQTVLKEHYFSQKSWNEVSREMELTRRTVYNIRNEAVSELVKLYTLADTIFHNSDSTNT